MDSNNKKIQLSIDILLAIFMICILPVLMHLYLYQANLSAYDWFSNQDEQASDFFLHIKMIAILVIGIIMLFILCCTLLKNKSIIKLNKSHYFLFGYLFFSLLSAILSINKGFSFKGSYEQFQPITVLLAYGIINIFMYLFLVDNQKLKILFTGWSVSICLLSIIGFFQFIGIDPLNTSVFKRLTTPRQYWETIDNMQLVTEQNRTYLTLFNPNYVGLFASLALPIFIVLMCMEKQKKRKMLYGIVNIGLLVCTIGSRSKNTVFALILPLIFIILILRKMWIEHLKLSILGVVSTIILILLFNTIGGNIFSNSIKNSFYVEDPKIILQDIQLTDTGVIFQFPNSKCQIDYSLSIDNNFSFSILDENHNVLETTYNEENNSLLITDPNYYNISIMPIFLEENYGFAVNFQGKQWIFSKDNTGKYLYYNDANKWTTFNKAESADIFKERLFTGRGYVWNRTLPLLKQHIFIGSGSDTFVLEYPQEDYVSNYNQGYENVIVTKPHNLYLQIGVETGIISLLCFLIFYFIYFIQSIRLYWKCKFEHMLESYGFAIFVGTIGFMISSLVNDSTVCVSPLFWGILGIGIGINRKLRNDM